MEAYVYLNSEGNITGWGTTNESPTDVFIDLEDNHEFFMRPLIYNIVDGELIKKPQAEIDREVNRPDSPRYEERIDMMEQAVLQLLMRG